MPVSRPILRGYVTEMSLQPPSLHRTPDGCEEVSSSVDMLPKVAMTCVMIESKE